MAGSSPRRHQVHDASRHADAALADVLARAFWDDPIMAWLVPDEAARYKRLRPFFRREILSIRAKGRVITTTDHDGAGLWAQPGRWKMSTLDLVRASPLVISAFRARLREGLAMLNEMERKHPTEPHWYLAVLGTHPWRQGLGVGGALITEVTDRCDREGIAAYLESSKLANVPYYERFGFRVTGEVSAPGGPTAYLMWRDPQ